MLSIVLRYVWTVLACWGLLTAAPSVVVGAVDPGADTVCVCERVCDAACCIQDGAPNPEPDPISAASETRSVGPFVGSSWPTPFRPPHAVQAPKMVASAARSTSAALGLPVDRGLRLAWLNAYLN